MRLDNGSPAEAARGLATVRPPAKLNLFLELLARREDGFHEIDTVMVPIDWCDCLQLRRTEDPEIRLQVNWLPSTPMCARRLAMAADELRLPEDESNLVYQALRRFLQSTDVSGGFDCRLHKRIPAGAGMGGASSDAAAALRCAAKLCGFPDHWPPLRPLATELGSDVPFFLGSEHSSMAAARARGRGEQITPVSSRAGLDLVVVFPGESLSTATVYAASTVPRRPRSADPLLQALKQGNRSSIGREMMNRLSEPAKEIAPRIAEILKSMWRAGLRTCQLTGSGSACFAIANSPRHARRASAWLRSQLEPGVFVKASRTIRVPPLVEIGNNQ